MKKSTRDSLIIGFALFSMFFGAGNLIFPAFLGNQLGDQFYLGVIGFIVTGVGLPLLAIVTCSKLDGSFETMASRVGKKFAIFCTAMLFIAIGPMLGIPRTAATTYELAINPFFPQIPMFVVIIGYFLVNLFFVLKQSSIIDTIGKYLTPILLIILFVIVTKGIIMPIGDLSNTNAINVFSSSLLEGYQTMDALAALLFAGIITKSIKDKGYSKKETPSMILKSSLVAIIGLAFVYGGLMYLGAQTASTATDMGKTALLLHISQSVLGQAGSALIGLAMGVACLTTSIGLVTAGASFFEKATNGKVSYKTNAIIISIVSLCIALLGVDNIVVLSNPILNILYPVSITLIITTLFNKFFTNDLSVKFGVYTSLIFGILFVVPGLNLSFIPMASIGFGWVLPTLISMMIGYFVSSSRKTVPSEVN